jgi:hypothetical protein
VTDERVIWCLQGPTIHGSANLPTFTAGWHLAGMGDFNGDGYSDIVLQNVLNGERVIWRMDHTTINSSTTLPTSWVIRN